MNAFEIPGLRYSLPAGGAVALHRFVSVSAGSLGVQASGATQIIGVSRNAVETDKGIAANQQIVEIADGIVVVEAAGAVTAGVAVYSDASGKATVTGGEGVVLAGTALTGTTVAGGLITVKVQA